MNIEIKNPRRQGGAILVVGLVLLLVLLVLGISTMNTASLELSMAGNDQFQENAFQMAETGIECGDGIVEVRGGTRSGRSLPAGRRA